uniref:Uncharacterized protein n=1 Tax=Manihot esculenta TaxID=3983 RepID=A0A199UAB5_MANES
MDFCLRTFCFQLLARKMSEVEYYLFLYGTFWDTINNIWGPFYYQVINFVLVEAVHPIFFFLMMRDTMIFLVIINEGIIDC